MASDLSCEEGASGNIKIDLIQFQKDYES
jgi:hypothetical protein